jgi:hypothetical protein
MKSTKAQTGFVDLIEATEREIKGAVRGGIPVEFA